MSEWTTEFEGTPVEYRWRPATEDDRSRPSRTIKLFRPETIGEDGTVPARCSALVSMGRASHDCPKDPVFVVETTGRPTGAAFYLCRSHLSGHKRSAGSDLKKGAAEREQKAAEATARARLRAFEKAAGLDEGRLDLEYRYGGSYSTETCVVPISVLEKLAGIER